MAPTPSKLIRHRWDMHALQALAKRDPDELTRIFTELKELPKHAIDTQVQTFGFGAPMQFHTFGFFDRTSEGCTPTAPGLFDRVVSGDTLLLVALRHHDPLSAVALIKLGASQTPTNSEGYNALEAAFEALAFLRLHPEADGQQNALGSTRDARLLAQRSQYEQLFAVLHDELAAFHAQQKAATERGLLELYEAFAPERVAKIPAQLDAFVFRERLLLENVKKKYQA